mgnify:CR=1 FL=1
MKERIVLAHAGGTGTAAAISWLAREYGADVVTLTVDLGQGRQLDGVHERALALGASRAHVIDAREEFVRDFMLPALCADAWQPGRPALVRPLGRALVARRLVDIAKIEGATAVAHGDRDAGAEPPFATMIRALDRSLDVIPVMQVASARGRAVPSDDGPGVDANLWGRAMTLDAARASGEPSDEIYALTKAVDETPEQAAYVDIAFACGVPTAINGVEMALVELIQSLQTIAGAHGVGRGDAIDQRADGQNARVISEAPAATALAAAHAELQRLVTSRDVERLASDASGKYFDLAATGRWFTPARKALNALVNEVQQHVTGTVRLKLHKGDCRVVSRESAAPVATEPAAETARQ